MDAACVIMSYAALESIVVLVADADAIVAIVAVAKVCVCVIVKFCARTTCNE